MTVKKSDGVEIKTSLTNNIFGDLIELRFSTALGEKFNG